MPESKWLTFLRHAKFIEPQITMAQAMYLWEKARDLCGFKGSKAEPVRVRPWRCSSCGAFVEHVFFYPYAVEFLHRVPWHWVDGEGKERCGPCEKTEEWTPNSVH